MDQAQSVLKKTLKRDPTPKEVARYLETHGNKSSAAHGKEVDPSLVKDVTNDLRDLLGREPTAKEVEDFLNDMD